MSSQLFFRDFPDRRQYNGATKMRTAIFHGMFLAQKCTHFVGERWYGEIPCKHETASCEKGAYSNFAMLLPETQISG